jgi:hypothetical protein
MEWFYLLLKTPIGHADVLRRAGRVEIADSGSFELPPGAVEAAETTEAESGAGFGFPVVESAAAEGVAHATTAVLPDVSLAPNIFPRHVARPLVGS